MLPPVDVGQGRLLIDEPMDLPKPIIDAIERTGQRNVLRFWPSLRTEGRDRLAAQLRAIDWEGFDELVETARSGRIDECDVTFLQHAASPAAPRLAAGDAAAAARASATIAAGEAALAAGRAGAILVAGGQGTRLKCTGPKGIYPIGPVSHASLFEILLGGLSAVRRRYGRAVPIAIMTSSATDADTRAYLEAHRFCGLDPSQVLIFRQADLPALAADSLTMLLDAPDRIAMAPDGHGGMLRALAAADGFAWFEARGVDLVASFQVDNPIARPLDPEFLGTHLLDGADITTQVIEKTDPAERVGVVAVSNGTVRVVEYSDLPETLARERSADGGLRFRAGSIAIHCFRLGFLAEAAATRTALPLHLARKAVPFVDGDGARIHPTAPNAIKFERFIFDLFPRARRVACVGVDPSDGFAPLKNPPGSERDGPEQVRRAMVAVARKRLERAGITVADGVAVELDAATILDERDVRGAMAPGSRIESPCVVGSGRLG